MLGCGSSPLHDHHADVVRHEVAELPRDSRPLFGERLLLAHRLLSFE
jgi:hypothetical protein